MSRSDILWKMGLHFALLSLIAVGGANTVMPEIYAYVVDVNRWMTSGEFADLFAIGQLAPLRAMVTVSLVGWKVAGLPGVLVATGAMSAPSCLLTYAVTRVWYRFRAARWRAAVQGGLAPLTIGLVVASGWILMLAANQEGWRGFALTAAAALIMLRSRLNPLWLLGAAGLLGGLGAV